MNRIFEFSPGQLKIILFLSVLLVVLALIYFVRSFSSVDEPGFELTVNVADEDQRYLPPLKVDLNHSPADSLELLPGIGPVLAGRIVAFRDSARFEAIADILKIQGIGIKTYETIKPYLEVQKW